MDFTDSHCLVNELARLSRLTLLFVDGHMPYLLPLIHSLTHSPTHSSTQLVGERLQLKLSVVGLAWLDLTWLGWCSRAGRRCLDLFLSHHGEP